LGVAVPRRVVLRVVGIRLVGGAGGVLTGGSGGDVIVVVLGIVRDLGIVRLRIVVFDVGIRCAVVLCAVVDAAVLVDGVVRNGLRLGRDRGVVAADAGHDTGSAGNVALRGLPVALVVRLEV